MSKQQQFKELREELTEEYEKEMANVQKLIDGGVTYIENGKAALHFDKQNSLIQEGQAGRIFREEVVDALNIMLERYARNLKKEFESLGLKFDAEPKILQSVGEEKRTVAFEMADD